MLLSPSDYSWRDRNTGRAVLRGKSPGLGISGRGQSAVFTLRTKGTNEMQSL